MISGYHLIRGCRVIPPSLVERLPFSTELFWHLVKKQVGTLCVYSLGSVFCSVDLCSCSELLVKEVVSFEEIHVINFFSFIVTLSVFLYETFAPSRLGRSASRRDFELHEGGNLVLF